MNNPIRIGIAGLNHGETHTNAFNNLPNVTLAAIADTDSSRLEKLGTAYPDAARFESADELIQSADIDAVVIATPSYLHERQIATAFDKSLHVLCESPVGIRSSEVSHVVTSAGLVGKTFMWSNPLRFDPRISEARKLIEAGTVGEVFRASSSQCLPTWPHAADSWRLDRERGGGALLECGLELLDATWFAIGAPDPMEAMAARYDFFAKQHTKGVFDIDKPAEDSIDGIIRFKDGTSLQHSAQIHQATIGPEPEKQMRIWGSNGTIDLLTGQLTTNSGTSQYATAASSNESCRLQAQAFADAIEQQTEPLNSGKQALAAMKMLDALANSAKEKHAVNIKVERSLNDLFGGL